MKTIKLFISVLTGLGLLTANALAGDGKVDTQASKLKWTGYHLAKSYEHYGNVSIKSGDVNLNGDQITSGTIVVDMNTITNDDVAKEKDNQKLVNHLKSDDFFGVKDNPEAKISIKNTKKSGDKTYKATADLTIRGITKEVQFDINVTKSTNTVLELKTDFNIQRTDYKVMYGWKVENAILGGEFRLESTIVINR